MESKLNDQFSLLIKNSPQEKHSLYVRNQNTPVINIPSTKTGIWIHWILIHMMEKVHKVNNLSNELCSNICFWRCKPEETRTEHVPFHSFIHLFHIPLICSSVLNFKTNDGKKDHNVNESRCHAPSSEPYRIVQSSISLQFPHCYQDDDLWMYNSLISLVKSPLISSSA